MSEPITQISVGQRSHIIRGHVDRTEAVDEVRRRLERAIALDTEALGALDRGEATVHHQRGINVPRNRRELPRPVTGVPASTHKLLVDLLDLVFYLRCRDCGSRWEVGANIPADIGDRVNELEQQPCGGELSP